MKVVIIGGRGTAIVVADQICDAHDRYGKDILPILQNGSGKRRWSNRPTGRKSIEENQRRN